jgi:hypothetical protein
MLLVEDEHVIHHVSTTAFNPALRDPILPGTAERGSDRRDVHVLDRQEHLAIERGVPIEDEILGGRTVRKGLPKLLTRISDLVVVLSPAAPSRLDFCGFR